MIINLPFELTNGNDGRGNKWFSSAKLRKQFEHDLKRLGLTREPFDVPVSVSVTRLLGPGQRLWDVSSIGRGNWKEIEDALVACGWFHDDGPKWITETRFYQCKKDRSQGPAILLEITPYSGGLSAFSDAVLAMAICEACGENPMFKGDARGNKWRWQDYLECVPKFRKAVDCSADNCDNAEESHGHPNNQKGNDNE